MSNPKPKTATIEIVVGPIEFGQGVMVGEVLADSHGNYPSFAYLFPDPEQRRRILRSLFIGVARDAQPFGSVLAAMAGDRMLGVAVWLPPGAFPWSPLRKVRGTGSFLPLLWRAPSRLGRFFALGRNAELVFPAEPHWYLEVLGVRKEAQGQGLGTRLLEPVLARADREGIPIYLETADRPNLTFYQKLGFEFDRQLQLIPDGPPHWAIRRSPQPGARS